MFIKIDAQSGKCMQSYCNPYGSAKWRLQIPENMNINLFLHGWFRCVCREGIDFGNTQPREQSYVHSDIQKLNGKTECERTRGCKCIEDTPIKLKCAPQCFHSLDLSLILALVFALKHWGAQFNFIIWVDHRVWSLIAIPISCRLQNRHKLFSRGSENCVFP